MFGNQLNPNSAMVALIAQSETSPAGKFEQVEKEGKCKSQMFSRFSILRKM